MLVYCLLLFYCILRLDILVIVVSRPGEVRGINQTKHGKYEVFRFLTFLLCTLESKYAPGLQEPPRDYCPCERALPILSTNPHRRQLPHRQSPAVIDRDNGPHLTLPALSRHSIKPEGRFRLLRCPFSQCVPQEVAIGAGGCTPGLPRLGAELGRRFRR